MTREEALKIAIGLRTDFKCKSDTMVEFCNVVIKALETELCDDAISRSEIINRLKGFERLHNEDELRTDLIDMILNLPSVILRDM